MKNNNKEKKEFKYVFGPVPSWRLGSSLGIDLLSQDEKICNFDCSYCQLGRTPFFTSERKIFVDLKEVIKELKNIPQETKIDYITFSGRGEPTLAANLLEACIEIRKIQKEPLAILTNSANLSLEQTLEAVSKIDFLIAKLDAFDQKSLEKINHPAPGINFDEILSGIISARKKHKGKFAIQSMIISENYKYADEFCKLYSKIMPDEIQINTPLRISPVKPLPEKDLLNFANIIRKAFPDVIVKTVYEEERPSVKPLSDESTLTRRGKIYE